MVLLWARACAMDGAETQDFPGSPEVSDQWPKLFAQGGHSVVIENNSVVIVWSIQSAILEIYDLSSCEIILTRLIYQQMVPY